MTINQAVENLKISNVVIPQDPTSISRDKGLELLEEIADITLAIEYNIDDLDLPQVASNLAHMSLCVDTFRLLTGYSPENVFTVFEEKGDFTGATSDDYSVEDYLEDINTYATEALESETPQDSLRNIQKSAIVLAQLYSHLKIPQQPIEDLRYVYIWERGFMVDDFKGKVDLEYMSDVRKILKIHHAL